jgi:hypothetical protein
VYKIATIDKEKLKEAMDQAKNQAEVPGKK